VADRGACLDRRGGVPALFRDGQTRDGNKDDLCVVPADTVRQRRERTDDGQPGDGSLGRVVIEEADGAQPVLRRLSQSASKCLAGSTGPHDESRQERCADVGSRAPVPMMREHEFSWM